MLAVHGVLPSTPTLRPPIVLVHGAANSAIVWTFWQAALAEHGWPSYAIDLRGHGASQTFDLSRTSMHDYANDVRLIASQLAKPPVLMGWSMGGLAAMIAADASTPAVVGLAPSTPERAVNPGKVISAGEFGPEEYGITSDDPNAQPFMPDLDTEERVIALSSLGKESRFARGERAAGIVLTDWHTPLLIATGTADRQWPADKYDDLPMPAQRISIDGASHWGLVLSRRAVATLAEGVCEWIESTLDS